MSAALRRTALGWFWLSLAAWAQPLEPWREVEIIRTEHGVPHIRAANLRAAGYALGWLQCEDYGRVTPDRLWSTRGQTARVKGRRAIDDDFEALQRQARARETYHLLEAETRDFYEGFALGVNRYIEQHREEFPAHMVSDFNGYDIGEVLITIVLATCATLGAVKLSVFLHVRGLANPEERPALRLSRLQKCRRSRKCRNS
nr:penicillin amidase [uncultured bacterium]